MNLPPVLLTDHELLEELGECTYDLLRRPDCADRRRADELAREARTRAARAMTAAEARVAP